MPENQFVGYVGDPDIHDGTILQVKKGEDMVRVILRGGRERKILAIDFQGVASVRSNRPEGMMLYSLSEMKAPAPLRRFVFTNWDDEDDAFLEITASNFSVGSMGKAQREELLQLLKDKFQEHERRPFPHPEEPVDPEIGELHGDLAEYDYYQTGWISRIIEKGKAPLWRARGDPRLAGRIQSLQHRKPESLKLLQAYQGVHEELQEMIDIINGLRAR